MTDPVDAIADALGLLRGHRGGPHGAPRTHDHDARRHLREPRDGHGERGRHAYPHGEAGMPFGAGRDRFGGPPARMRLLTALLAAGTSLSVSQIAEAIEVDQPRASRLIQQAVDAGLVRREVDPDDARRTRIVLSDRGRELARGFRGARRDAITSALGALDEGERAEFVRLLAKFAAAWPQR